MSQLTGYIMIITAAILLPIEFSFAKRYQASEGTSLIPGLKYNALNGIVTAFIFWVLNGFRLSFSLFSLLIAFSIAFCGVAYTLIGFRILKSGNMTLYSLFLMSGGMLLPYLFGVYWLNEPLTFLRILGIICILIAIVMSNSGKCSFGKIQLFYCTLVFILNGFVSILSKYHQIADTFPRIDSMSFIVYTGIAKFILSGFILCFQKGARQKPYFSSHKSLLLIIGVALAGGISYLLQLTGAKELPASVLYPIVTGGSIVFSAILGKIFFKEILTKYQLFGILLCFMGTCLFL